MSVFLTDGAARDLDEWYVALHATGGQAAARSALERISDLFSRLARGDLTGDVPRELRHLGLRATRQVLGSDGLRVVYEVAKDDIYVISLAPDGQSFQSLLSRRLLDA
ncbi:MAG: type II toxin-antitoxin system RelE/ParE family toxin [Trueperaceae bacterium]|nr:type II toxin-antitoxin system RelE/ParE family toxin [Trueperaceae bacterium]